MSTLGFKGGFAAFMDGFTKAQDKEYQRDRQKKEDDWVESQHKRTLDEQTRQDQLRQDLMEAGKDTIDESATTDPAKPVMRKRTQDELMFASADAYRKAGDIAKYHELATAGNKIAMERAANNFNRLYYNADGLAPEQLVNQAIGIFNQDPTVGHIENPQYREDGSVTFDTVNKRTGERISHTARDSKSLLEDMHAYYNPQGYAAKQARIAEQAAKVEKLGAGDQLVQNGRVIATNANEPAAVQAARIRAGDGKSNPEWDKALTAPPHVAKMFSFQDGMGNEKTDLSLSSAYSTAVLGAKQQGLTPGEAVVQGEQAVLMLQRAAQNMVAAAKAKDKKSPLTLQDAAAQIMANAPKPRPAAPQPAAAAGAKPALTQPGDADRAAIFNNELIKAKRDLNAATTDAQRERAQAAVDGIRREMQRNQIAETAVADPISNQAPAAAPAPAAKPAAPADKVKITDAGKGIPTSPYSRRYLEFKASRPGYQLSADEKAALERMRQEEQEQIKADKAANVRRDWFGNAIPMD